MPNWCSNRVSFFVDDQKDVAKLKSIFESDTPFNEIIPAPDWEKIPNDKGELPVEQLHRNDKGEVMCASWNFPDGTNDDRWYHWNISNWGVKWDISAQEVDDYDGFIRLEFDTPWGPPDEIYNRLVEMFPDVSISWFFDEPGMQFAGYLPND